MITARDVEFHTPADADHHWAETNMFCFHIAEHQLAGIVYNCFRKGLGVCVSEVIIFNRPSRERWDVLYIDSHQHLPAAERLSHYSLANGLTVQAVGPPRDYRLDYLGMDGCELHLDIAGLMEPYDIHDPSMAPTAVVNDQAAAAEKSGFGAGYSGHFDMAVKVRGTLTLYGRTLTVDCVDSMDHSWGPRTERGMKSMCWAGGHLGEGYVWHAIIQKNVGAAPEDEFRIANGYILEDGKVLGLRSGRMVVTRRADGVADAVELELVDRNDTTHHFNGTAVAVHDWIPHTCLHVGTVLYEYEARGLTGFGTVQEALPLEIMARRNGQLFVESLGS